MAHRGDAMTGQPLHKQYKAIRMGLHVHQQTIADHLGVSVFTVSSWDSGRHSPHIQRAIGYAHFLDHELVIARHNAILQPVAEVLPDIAGLRRACAHTWEVAQRMHVTVNAVTEFERRIAKGAQPALAALLAYLRGFEHDLQLIPMAAEQGA
jgi:DNA-binding transcriptional regulator YiaG